MAMSNVAVQKYYARLLYRGIFVMDQVPVEDRENVKNFLDEMINTMGPYVPDPEISTPEDRGEVIE